MTKEMLKTELALLETRLFEDKKSLYKKYALANNPYKIGDIISDHSTTIEIKSIGVYMSYSEPICVYKGIQLNKDGKINKKQDNTTIYQSNVKTPE